MLTRMEPGKLAAEIPQGGGPVVLHGVSWECYESLLGLLGDDSVATATDVEHQRSFRVAARRVAEVVTTLIARDWSVSVQRKPYRRLDRVHLSGSSGIDWLEITGTAEVGGEEFPLGELMRALRQRRRSGALVQFGSHTVVAPEELLDRLERLLELGAGSDEAESPLRLARAHAGAAISFMDSASSRQEDADFRKLRRCLEQGLVPTPASPPHGFRGTLREYQHQGLGWLR